MKNRINMNDYEIIKEIGEGAFGTVMLGKKTSNGKFYAIKRVNKESLCNVDLKEKTI
jgi:serine/threonine protein kinase